MKRLIPFLLLVFSLPLLAQNSARMLSGVNAQTGTTYPFVAQDATRLVTFNNPAPIAATLPSGLTSGFSTGTLFSVLNVGSGTLTITCSGCSIFSNGSTGSATLILNGGQGADIYSAGQNYWAQAGAGSGGITNPLNVQNLNVSGTTNLNGPSNFAQGFNSQAPGNWQGGFPAFGAPFDPFCAYMVSPTWWQMCVFPDPNNGSGVLAFNDGVGTPNVNKYPMMTDTLPSYQPQGVVNCWNQATMTMSFSIPCRFVTNVVMNTGSNGSGITVGQESDITVTDPGSSGLTGPNIYGNLVRTDVGPNAHISTVGSYRVQQPLFEAGSVTTNYYGWSVNPAPILGTIVNSAEIFTNPPVTQYGVVTSGLVQAIIATDTVPQRSGICHANVGVDLPLTALHDCHFSGTGSPNGVMTANVGSIYSRQDGGLGTSVYIKESGSGNTGWDAVQPILTGTPTISSGFGTSPSVTLGTTPAAFRINVGTGGAASTGVIGLPSNTNGWNCSVNDITTTSTNVFITKQTGAGTATTVPIGNFSNASAAGPWAASDILSVNCSPVL